jgi:hypothetical protein
MAITGGNNKKALFGQFVNNAWVEITKICPNHRGVDDFNKGMCDHSKNSSYGFLDGHEGLMRCSILACPHAEKAYDLARKMQSRETHREGDLDLFNQSRPHLRVVKTA